jgi:hypothetical protein
MNETIEVAKTGRARCRSCRQAIEKGSLRFGEEVASAFTDGPQQAWHHLTCAAAKKPAQVRAALAAFDGEVPDRAAIDTLLAESEAKVKVFPYAERAPSARSKCLECEETIPKAAWRVAIEREVEVMGVPRTSAGYLHPGCVAAHLADDGVAQAVIANSKGLSDADRAELGEALGA